MEVRVLFRALFVDGEWVRESEKTPFFRALKEVHDEVPAVFRQFSTSPLAWKAVEGIRLLP